MGGNAIINGLKATRIDLTSIKRNIIIPVLHDLLESINTTFEEYSGTLLWSSNLFKSLEFFSGSSKYFMDSSISDEIFGTIKSSIGDLDLQVDQEYSELLEGFLETILNTTIGDFALKGFKKSPGQFITIWDVPLIGIIQLDFELVEYENDFPSDWSQFSHSSPWEDLQLGIKGVFHKYAIRALTAKTLGPKYIIRNSKSGIEIASIFAFSVQRGLRQKLEATGASFEFREISIKDSVYVTDISDMFQIIFGFKSLASEPYFYSFDGILHLVNTIFSKEEKIKFFNGFNHTLWGPGAQKLYRNNPGQDFKDKMKAYTMMSNKLGLIIDPNIIQDYYTDYQ